MYKRMRVGLLIACLTAGPLLWAGQPAAAATACYSSPNNTDCNGASPYQTVGVSSCWDDAYVVPRGNGDFEDYTDPNTGWEYVVYLWYSPYCGTNWSEVDAYSYNAFASAQFSTKVRRYAGPDGSYLMEHMPGSVTLNVGVNGLGAISPMVYSRDNPAQACLSLPPFTGTPDQIKCTAEW